VVANRLDNRVLIVGAGTLARGCADMMAKAGKPIAFALNSGRKPVWLDGHEHLFEKVYLAGDHDMQKRVNRASKWCKIEGAITRDSPIWKKFTGVLDCANPAGTAANFESLYPDGIPVICQGGTNPDMTPGLIPFLSAPGSKLFGKELKTGWYWQGSCNNTMSTSAILLIQSVVGSDNIDNVLMEFFRRFGDPGCNRSYVANGDGLERNKKYERHMFERINGIKPDQITALVNKNPWQHYHIGFMTVTFSRDITDDEVEQFTDAFRSYPRGIYMEKPYFKRTDSQRTMNQKVMNLVQAYADIDIPHPMIKGHAKICAEGDVALPMYNFERLSKRQAMIYMINPQQSVTLQSTMDGALALFYGVDKAYEETNKIFRHQCKTRACLKEQGEMVINQLT